MQEAQFVIQGLIELVGFPLTMSTYLHGGSTVALLWLLHIQWCWWQRTMTVPPNYCTVHCAAGSSQPFRKSCCIRPEAALLVPPLFMYGSWLVQRPYTECLLGSENWLGSLPGEIYLGKMQVWTQTTLRNGAYMCCFINLPRTDRRKLAKCSHRYACNLPVPILLL